MPKIEILHPNTPLVTGDNAYILLGVIIDLHNQYIDVFKSRNKGVIYKIHWNYGIKLRLNDLEALTNWKRDKVRTTLTSLVTGIMHQDTIFKPLKVTGNPTYDKQGREIPSGYYIIDIEELKRLDRYCSKIVVNWKRKNGTKQIQPCKLLKVLANENYDVLNKYQCGND